MSIFLTRIHRTKAANGTATYANTLTTATTLPYNVNMQQLVNNLPKVKR